MKMHPFFRYGHGSTSPVGHGPNTRKDSMPRSKSPSGSCDEDEQEQTSLPKSGTSHKLSASPSSEGSHKAQLPTVPIIKVEDEVVVTSLCPLRNRDRARANENRKRLGPNKNNIILETLQNELKGGTQTNK